MSLSKISHRNGCLSYLSRNPKPAFELVFLFNTYPLQSGHFADIFIKEFKLKSIATLCLTSIVIFFSNITHAQELPNISTKKPLVAYVVSAVLRKADTETVIKLLQSLQLQASPEAAEKALLDQVVTDYSGYVVVTTLVNPVSTLLTPVKSKKQHLLSS